MTGPYRVSRNPMYTGLSVALVGTGLCAGSWWPLIVAPLCMLATYRWVIRAEEGYEEIRRLRAEIRRLRGVSVLKAATTFFVGELDPRNG